MKTRIWNILRIALIIAAVCLCAAQIHHNQWLYDQPKFQSLTIELGQSIPEFTQFQTEHADPKLAQQVTPLSEIDPTRAGVYELTFSHGSKVEQVTLTIQDTVAPTAVFHDVNAVTGQILTPEDFVSEAYDLSGTTITFADGGAIPASYGDAAVEIVVTDASGNTTTGTCRIYYVWMIDSFTMELGQTVTKADLLMDLMKDATLLKQDDLDAINASPAGTYTVTSTDGDQSCSCEITIVDTTPPELVLKEVAFFLGGTAKLEDFVVSATDLSGEVTLELMTELNFETVGIQTVTVKATDVHGNVTTAETTLTIQTDNVPPVFYGLWAMTVEKHSTPDYRTGISAYDAQDGYVSFTVDASAVDTSRQGTYYALYTAVDSSGNKVLSYRRIVVSHDAEDTAALVTRTAASLSDDPLAVRNYVRNLIYYSYYDWGGGDPVWYGLTTREGNCYVYAKVLQRLLTEKGYTCQLIWVTDEYSPHYWVLLHINGVWRHIDATPATNHMRYDLMTDEQRLETLSGRTWDRSQWPAAE